MEAQKWINSLCIWGISSTNKEIHNLKWKYNITVLLHKYFVGICGFTVLSNDIRGGIKENLRGKYSSVSIDSSTENCIPEKWIIWKDKRC